MFTKFDINGFVSITIIIVNNLLGKVRFKSNDADIRLFLLMTFYILVVDF